MTESVSDIAGLGTVLGIWAHPDDEAYLSGGLMAMARGAGSRVVCVTATCGELGTPDPETWPPQRLAPERRVELARCLAVLGVSEHHWLGYHDGRCADVPVGDAVRRTSPTSIGQGARVGAGTGSPRPCQRRARTCQRRASAQGDRCVVSGRSRHDLGGGQRWTTASWSSSSASSSRTPARPARPAWW